MTVCCLIWFLVSEVRYCVYWNMLFLITMTSFRSQGNGKAFMPSLLGFYRGRDMFYVWLSASMDCCVERRSLRSVNISHCPHNSRMSCSLCYLLYLISPVPVPVWYGSKVLLFWHEWCAPYKWLLPVSSKPYWLLYTWAGKILQIFSLLKKPHSWRLGKLCQCSKNLTSIQESSTDSRHCPYLYLWRPVRLWWCSTRVDIIPSPWDTNS